MNAFQHVDHRVFTPLAIAALAAVYFASFLTYGVNLEDEGLILHQIARTARGDLPYVDFHTGYTPGVFYLNAGLLQLFGTSIVPVRAALVLVNAATVGLLFALARPLAGGALAAATALGYAAFLPFFSGNFASFNIPYPAWYAGTAWLATQAAFDRWVTSRSRGTLLMAGIAAGLAFGFKPNTGVLAGLACAMALGLFAAGDGDPDRRAARALLVVCGLALLLLLARPLVDLLTLDDWLTFPMIAAALLTLLAGRVVLARRRVAHGGHLTAEVALVVLGAALATLPWLPYLLARLGPARFASDVLLLGSGAEEVYATPYPQPLGLPDAWAPLAAGVVVVIAVLGLAAERRRVRRGAALGVTTAGALGFAALVAFLARMPEGVRRSVLWQVEQTSFFLVPALGIAGVARALHCLRGGGELHPSAQRALAALVFALVTYVQLYPRVDFMHLIMAVPSALVLGAGAAARVARAWERVLGFRPGRLAGLLAAAAGGVAAFAALPNFLGLPGPQETVTSAVLPVHVESAHAADLRALDDLLAYLRPRLAPGAPVLGFPALALVPFALERPSPTHHDYFFPGRPDHRAEAEIVRTLAREPPRYLVTLNRRLGFFANAPAYYFILCAFLREHYVLEARFGRYDLLVRRGPVPPAEVPVEAAPAARDRATVLAWLAGPDRELRRAAVAVFLGEARDAAGVAGLAGTWASGQAERLLLVRNLGEWGDERALPFLVDVATSSGRRLRVEATNALSLIALRARVEQHLLAGDDGRLADAVDRSARVLPLSTLRGWIAEPELRAAAAIFAARVLAAAGDRVSVPALEVMLGKRDRTLRVVAAEALLRLGHPEQLCVLVDMLAATSHEVQDVVPGALLDAARTYPEMLAGCLAHGLMHRAPLARETTAWIAGAAGLEAVAPAVRHALDDPQRGVRIAAAWAAGRLRDGEARAALMALAGGRDAELGAVATEAIAKIDSVNSPR